MVKKSYKTILPSLFSVSLMLVVLATVSVAWFSMNKQVETGGMNLSVEVTPNLIIAKTSDGIKAVNQTTAAEAFSINYTEKFRANMMPATEAVSDNEWEAKINEIEDNVTGLKYVYNTHDIDYTSGLKKQNGADLTFKAVPESTESKYYIDYDIFIASAGKPLEGYKLTANIFCESNINTHKAATVVFYQGEPNAANYIGSIAVAKQGNDSVSFELEDDIIPLNTDSERSPIHITARCFFDGALTYSDEESESTKAYINSATVDISGVDLKIIFTAVEKPKA